MKIYTKSGDKGQTGIHGGRRVEKDDIRIEANGTVDELNALIGVIRTMLPERHAWQEMLFTIQKELMTVMSHIATPSDIRDKNPNALPEELTAFCEQQIDLLEAGTTASRYFILPGGTPLSAYCHLARTVARRAERRLWTLNRIDPLPSVILTFMNRLSDLFFIMARYEMQQQGAEEERWHSFLYKRKNNAR
ncbi:MAG: cob(I)yrinic acid a,c-diamide adenosyltransferase [Parabacteroides sp.]|nr:cob(I)yrinic acid a,c-diamide adenosyltransferase [Parabacteroides sp.]